MRRHTDQHKKHRARASSTRRLQQRPLLESLLAEEEVEINKVETTKSVTPAAVIEIDEEEDPRPTALPTMEKEGNLRRDTPDPGISISQNFMLFRNRNRNLKSEFVLPEPKFRQSSPIIRSRIKIYTAGTEILGDSDS
jgi:cell envelope opacity-associated protein A